MKRPRRFHPIGVASRPVAGAQGSDERPARAGRRRFHSGYARIRTIESFRHRNFRMMWMALLCAAVCSWIINITTGWLTYDLTGSALLTGLSIGMGALPPVIAGPIAGVLVDSLDRRMVMAFSMGSLAFFLAAFGLIVLTGFLQTWHVFAMSFLIGVSGSFLMPAEQALLANVVPKRLLVNAFALVAFAWSISRLFAPAAAGFLIAYFGPGVSVMAAAFVIVIGVWFTLRVRIRRRSARPIRLDGVAPDLLDAVKYIKGSQVVLATMALTAALLMFVASVNMGLMPVFAQEVYEAGPQILGLLVASLGAGMTIGTLAVASLGGMERRGRMALLTAALTGVGLMAFSRTGELYFALPILIFYGATMVMTWTVAGALIQTIVPDDMRGRVSALTTTVHAVFPVGALCVGAMAQVFGAPLATLISGSAVLAFVVATPFAFPAVWSYRAGVGISGEDSRPGGEPAAETAEAAEPQAA